MFTIDDQCVRYQQKNQLQGVHYIFIMSLLKLISELKCWLFIICIRITLNDVLIHHCTSYHTTTIITCLYDFITVYIQDNIMSTMASYVFMSNILAYIVDGYGQCCNSYTSQWGQISCPFIFHTRDLSSMDCTPYKKPRNLLYGAINTQKMKSLMAVFVAPATST